ncbi:MAG: hypothetical protein H6607_06550 [Flavobacteriales bacterium]|nr:hypothetical protein [Flavobacteriales bacterium]
MKYLKLILLLLLSNFTNGQNKERVLADFSTVVVFDNFSTGANRWEQKNTESEQFIISENKYSISRLKPDYFSVALAKDIGEYSDFELVTKIEAEKVKSNKNAGGGVIIKAQKDGSGALIIEINAKKQYRIKLLKNGVFTPLFHTKNGGWEKSKHLKKGENELKIRTKGNEFDIYFNGKFERSFIETSFAKGRQGFYVNGNSRIKAGLFLLKANEISELKQNPIDSKTTGNDQTYTELVKVFKDKIDKQNQEIERLTEELNICKTNLTIDTTSASKVKELNKDNVELKSKVAQLETELQQAQKRLTYLESMKEDIEKQTDGDLVLSLTELLSKEKEKNKALKAENDALKKEVGELRRRGN